MPKHNLQSRELHGLLPVDTGNEVGAMPCVALCSYMFNSAGSDSTDTAALPPHPVVVVSLLAACTSWKAHVEEGRQKQQHADSNERHDVI